MGWLALAAIVAFSHAAVRVSGIGRRSTTFVLAAALSIAGPTWLGRLTSDFEQATLLTGLVAALGACLLWRAPPQTAAPRDSGRTPVGLWIPIGIMTVGVVWATLGSHFWDEHSCHYSTAAVIARGVLPPEHPLFPGEPFRYHFGYDVLAAHAFSLTRVPIDVALDAATIASFALLLAACRDVGRRLGGRWGGGFAMLVTPLGGGTLAFLLFGDMGPLELHWSALPVRWMSSTPPPVISNFFQHPQGLGMSFALVVVLTFADLPAAPKARRSQLAVGTFLLGVLALVHIVFFAVLGLSLGVMVLARTAVGQRSKGPSPILRAAGDLGALLAALGIGYTLGGFFAPGPPVEQVLVWGTSFFKGSWGSVVAQHLVLFGLPLLFLPWAVIDTVRRPTPLTVALVAAATVGFAVPNVVTYARSWDIVKFLGVGMFFASLLFAARLGRWVPQGRRPAIAAVAAAVLATNTAWIWLVRCSVLDGKHGVPKIHFPGSSRPAHALSRALDDLIPPRDRVFVTDVELARAGGFLTPGFDWRQVGVGFMLDRPKAERWYRTKQRARRTLAPGAMHELDVRWAVFAPRDLAFLEPEAGERLKNPEYYERVADVGEGVHRRLVYRLKPPAYGGSTIR